VTERGAFERLQVPPGSKRSRAGWVFGAIWLVYLSYPLDTLFQSRPSVLELVLVFLLVGVFAAAYVMEGMLAGRDWDRLPPTRLGDRRKLVLLGVMAAVATVLPPAVNGEWVVLWIYVASACGFALPLGRPPSWAARGGLAATGAMSLFTLILGLSLGDWLQLLLPCVFSCLGSIGMRGTHELIRELTQARAEVARLAAGEERLRLARDMHDLAGHSLATITLKAELARKLLRVDTERAEQQIFDLEQVSRQALADIREAVSGYRRATLAVETASAATALRAAGIEPDIEPSVAARSGSLDPEAESALAWCLREAVTNVVRHSGARTCRVRLIDARVDGEPSLTLEVFDDGPFARSARPRPGASHGAEAETEGEGEGASEAGFAEGNGLSGLRERLSALSEDAVLSAGPADPGGFRLTATVPARLAA
jgi:two-component system sensor histidine kinase DesK